LSQGVYQQTQAARSNDAQRGEAARNAQKMRELLQKHIESVEDSYESSDDHVTVNEDGQGSGQAGYYDPLPKKPRATASQEEADDQQQQADESTPPASPLSHVDLTA
jgi:hypothetical protein